MNTPAVTNVSNVEDSFQVSIRQGVRNSVAWKIQRVASGEDELVWQHSLGRWGSGDFFHPVCARVWFG